MPGSASAPRSAIFHDASSRSNTCKSSASQWRLVHDHAYVCVYVCVCVYVRGIQSRSSGWVEMHKYMNHGETTSERGTGTSLARICLERVVPPRGVITRGQQLSSRENAPFRNVVAFFSPLEKILRFRPRYRGESRHG